jgi:uncharacterized protein involved in response to NO
MTGTHPAVWRRDPFRVFFPLGVLLAWVGIGHWLLYATGAIRSYSCLLHGLVQMQAFMMAFATGFLMTALPRRTQSAPPSTGEMAGAVAALVATTAGAAAERWWVAEVAYLVLLTLLLRFALGRLGGPAPGRRPPAAFTLIPIALLHGVLGAGLILAATGPGGPAWAMGLGRLCVEQGVLLCLVVGTGGLVLPLVVGATPPADLGSSPRETGRALAYALLGGLVLVSLLLEHAGWSRGGPLLRAATVAAGLALGGAWRPPGRPGLHRRLVWVAAWLVPTGCLASALVPEYRVPALHVLFIGGFSLLAFAVATHVVLGHLGLTVLAEGRPAPIVILGVAFLLAMLARLAADASSTYFAHLGWAAGSWIAGSAVWLAFVGRAMLCR